MNQKIIAFNGAPLTWPDSGIKFYTLALLRELTSRDDEFYYKIFIPEKCEYRFDRLKTNNIIIRQINIFPKVWNFLNRGLWEIYQLPKVIKQHKVDLFFSPHQARTFLSLNMSSVVVVHDTLQWDRSIQARDWGRQFLYNLYKKGVKKATKIITISETSQKDIVHYLNMNKSEIIVAYEGVDQFFLSESNHTGVKKILNKFQIDKPYILYVGGFHTRKNILSVMESFGVYVKKFKNENIYLIIPGKPHRLGAGITNPSEVEELATHLGIINQVKMLEDTTREELKALYRGANLFIYLSMYEGFGLPPLEAMSQGVPVIASNKSSIPEIFGDSAILVDPKNFQRISNHINQLLTNRKLRSEMIKKGHNKVKEFNWKKTGDIIINTFRSLIS